MDNILISGTYTVLICIIALMTVVPIMIEIVRSKLSLVRVIGYSFAFVMAIVVISACLNAVFLP